MLQTQLANAVVIHLDDFIHPRKIRYDDSVTEWEAFYYKQWRFDYLRKSILQPLASGLPVNATIELYHKETDQYVRTPITIPIGTQVILEGVFLQRKEFRDFFDYVIYLDIDKNTRLNRVLERDTYIGTKEEIRAKYERRYFPAEAMYVKEYDPVRLADRVIPTKKFS